MSGKFFLDTNIFGYSLSLTAPEKSGRAEDLIREGLSSQMGVVSYQVVQEFFTVALGKITKPLSLAEAEVYLQDVFVPLLEVPFSPQLCTAAMRIFSRFGLSWYGSLIVAAAQQAKCEVLYTEDLQHGQRFGSLQVVNPFF